MTDHTLTAHSDCGPSSLERRILCVGSRNAERGLPDTSSKDAAEGTVFHEVASMCLEFGLEPDDFLDKEFEADGHTFTFDETFARHMRPGLERVRDMIDGCAYYGHETRVDISSITEPGQFGTTDNWAIDVERRVIKVHDWKYGEGVGVEAEGNWQAIAYAIGVWEFVGWQVLGNIEGVTCEITIDQMRRPDSGGTWVVSLAELFSDYAPVITAAVEASRDPDAPRTAGLKQCFFCKAKGRCPELARFSLEQASLKFDNLDETPTPVNELTPEQIAKIVLNRPLWSVWMSAVHELALARVQNGLPSGGLKMIPGRRGHRIWLKPDVAETSLKKFLGDRAYEAKLISPAMAEKRLTKEQLTDIEVLWHQRDTKPSLVAESDDREGLPNNTEKFDNLGD